MPKKIYDIVPPKVAQQALKKSGAGAAPKRKRASKKPLQQDVKAIFEPIGQQRKSSTGHHEVKAGGGFPVKWAWIAGGVLVLALCVYLYGALAKATIQVFPVTETLSFQEKISADTSYDNVNVLKNIIPARLVVQEASLTQEFPATGSASNDGKAAGTIKVYNKVSPATPITLKEGTHFLSDSGKYFVSLTRIVIPAMKGNVAGSIDVSVQAEESGTEYNIGASKFSVPKLSGTAYYYNIWAESKSSMAGGYTGNVKKVSKSDLATAKDVLGKKILEDAEASLRGQISADEVLLEGALIRSVIESTADSKEGDIKDAFNQTAKAKVSALVFKKDDIQKFAKLDAQSKLDDGKELLEESLQVSYVTGAVDMQTGTIKMDVSVSGQTYYAVDSNSFIDALPQKNASQIQQVISQQYPSEISKTVVNFWPFWVTKAPKDKGKIKIELEF